MNYQIFLSEVANLKSLMSAPNTFKTRRSIRKVKKNINKIVKEAAKSQAKIVYDQTVNLYEEILKSNLE